MKIYVAHSSSFDYQNELYEPLKQSGLAKAHKFFLPHDGGNPENSKDIIKDSDLLIAEVSYPSTGAGIEIGWANSFGVPIWAVYKEGTKPSSSIKHVAPKIFPYKDSADLVSILTGELKTMTK